MVVCKVVTILSTPCLVGKARHVRQAHIPTISASFSPTQSLCAHVWQRWHCTIADEHLPPCRQLATQGLISAAADSLFPLLLLLPFLLVVFASGEQAVSSGGNIITNGSNTMPFKLLSIVSGIVACILCGPYEAVVREVGFRSMAKSDNVQLFRITKSPISIFFHTSRSVSVLNTCSLFNIKQCHNQPELNSVRNRIYIAHKCRKSIEEEEEFHLFFSHVVQVIHIHCYTYTCIPL